MSNVLNFLLLVVPDSLLGSVLTLLVIAGGFAMILGFRAHGTALVVTAVAIPIVSAAIEAVTDELFTIMDGRLVVPISMAALLLVYLAIGWGLIKLVFGQRAIDEAKGHLLADAAKGVLRMAFTRVGLIAVGGLFLFLYLSVRS